MLLASFKKCIVALLIGSFVLSPFPFNYSKVSAQAGVTTTDWVTNIKTTITSIQSTLTAFANGQSLLNDTVLRKLANIMVDTMLRQMTSDIVQWINSGFQGSPAFTTDPAGLFMDIADETIGQFIESSDLGFLCSPFQLDIRIALAQSFQPYRRKASCTLTRIGDNVTGFIEGNNSGSWENWLARTTQPQNNPYTSYLMAQNEIAIRIAGRKEIKLAQLNWGSGFLSYDECIAYAPPEEIAGPLQPGQESLGTAAPRCIKTETKTPGSVIANQLDWAISSDIRRTELAKDIDQIVSALVGQMAKQALGGIGGLLGSSQPRQSSGGRSFLNTYNYNNADSLRLASGGQNEINNRISSSSTAFNSSFQQRETDAASQSTNVTGINGYTGPGMDLTERNLALSKVAIQSSINSGYGPHLAVDGNLGSIPSGYFPNIAATNNEDRPWWEVDLGKNYALNRVIISPQGDGNNPLTNFHLFTSPNPFPTNFNPLLSATFPVFKSALQNPPAPYTNNVVIPVNGNARYVRIQAVDTRILSIAEVRVFGADIPNGSGTENGTNPPNNANQPLATSLSPQTTQDIAFGRSGLFSSSFRVTGNKNAVGLKVVSNLYLISGPNKSPALFSSVFSQLQTRFRNSGINTPTTIPLGSSQYIVTSSADLSSDYEFSVSYTGTALPPCVGNRNVYCPYVSGGNYQLETTIKDADDTILGKQVTEFTFNP